MTAVSTREGSAANPERTALLRRRVRLLVAFTIGYNVIEGIIALVAGATADSAALIAFGLDSGVEVLSAAAVAWQFSRSDPERYEKPTLRVIAFAFFALAAYTIVSAALSLFGSADPQPSSVGIVLASISVVVMPVVSIIQRRTGQALGSATVVADAKQTLICSLLSGAVLLGLVANALFGWGWADAVAALVIGAFAIREGVEAWNGDTCATPIGELMESRDQPGDATRDDCC